MWIMETTSMIASPFLDIYIESLGNGDIVSWSSKKQKTVALSSMEAETLSICSASCELIYLSNLLSDLKIVVNNSINIFEDNQSAIKLLYNFQNNARCTHKQLSIKENFIIDYVKKGYC
jgi:hypothetical protein